MKITLMEILACPIDKHHPLEIYVFKERAEVIEGMIVCPKCLRWYPIKDEIPELLPDDLRDKRKELCFLRKWKDEIPKKIILRGKPFTIGK